MNSTNLSQTIPDILYIIYSLSYNWLKLTLKILCTTFNENQRFKAGPDGQWTFNAFNSVEHEFYAVEEYTISIADHTSAIYIYL